MLITMKYILKVIAAGITAFLLLCVFAAVYYNPSPHLPSGTGATDYIREPNALYAYMTEGHSFGKLDDGGFNNLGAMALNSQSPDVLFMGSSHIEAMYVPQRRSAPYVLNELLAPYGKTVYNIAMSSHTFERCLNNLDRALDVYTPGEYVVIETMSPTISMNTMEKLLSGSFDRLTSYDRGDWQYWIQQPPYIKLLYNQYRNAKETQSSSAPKHNDAGLYRANVEKTISYMAETAAAHGITAILFYHPALSLQTDGSAAVTYSQDDLDLLAAVCKETGVVFIDMTNIFMGNYNERHILPHGFANTEIGSGHLNTEGQKMVAQEIFRAVTERLP